LVCSVSLSFYLCLICFALSLVKVILLFIPGVICGVGITVDFNLALGVFPDLYFSHQLLFPISLLLSIPCLSPYSKVSLGSFNH